MKHPPIGFIGGGRITRVFLQAWRRAQIDISNTTVSDRTSEVLAGMQGAFPEVGLCSDNRIPASQRIVFIALHPPAIRTAVPELRGVISKEAVVVSLAPVITFAELQELLGHSRLVRMVPNAPSMIGRGYNPVTYSPAMTSDDRQLLEPLFTPLGVYPEVPEEHLEAYAVLTAMGPTYFWFQWQALRELGRSFGLEPEQADRALLAMLKGASEMLLNSGIVPGEVMDTIPLKPLSELEGTFRSTAAGKLSALYQKLKNASCEHLKATGERKQPRRNNV